MLDALLEDFGSLPGVETLAFPFLPNESAAPKEQSLFCALAKTADWTLVVAPEFDDLLLTRCRWLEQVGARSLGPTPAAVALTTSSGWFVAAGSGFRLLSPDGPPYRVHVLGAGQDAVVPRGKVKYPFVGQAPADRARAQ